MVRVHPSQPNTFYPGLVLVVTRLAVDQECQDRNLEPGPKLEDYAMAVAEQRFYRGDALRLGSRKQFYGVCVKPIEILRISSATNKNFHFG